MSKYKIFFSNDDSHVVDFNNFMLGFYEDFYIFLNTFVEENKNLNKEFIIKIYTELNKNKNLQKYFLYSHNKVRYISNTDNDISKYIDSLIRQSVHLVKELDLKLSVNYKCDDNIYRIPLYYNEFEKNGVMMKTTNQRILYFDIEKFNSFFTDLNRLPYIYAVFKFDADYLGNIVDKLMNINEILGLQGTDLNHKQIEDINELINDININLEYILSDDDINIYQNKTDKLYEYLAYEIYGDDIEKYHPMKFNINDGKIIINYERIITYRLDGKTGVKNEVIS